MSSEQFKDEGKKTIPFTKEKKKTYLGKQFKKYKTWPGMMAHTCNTSTREADQEAWLYRETLSQKKERKKEEREERGGKRSKGGV
jgi:hypothetical protein